MRAIRHEIVRRIEDRDGDGRGETSIVLAKGWDAPECGPIAGVLPIGPGSPMGFSLAPGLTDGHIYTTISLGRGRMPSYRRISPDGRWDIVNYIRDLNGQGGR